MPTTKSALCANSHFSVTFNDTHQVAFTYSSVDYDRSAMNPQKLGFKEMLEIMNLKIELKELYQKQHELQTLEKRMEALDQSAIGEKSTAD